MKKASKYIAVMCAMGFVHHGIAQKGKYTLTVSPQVGYEYNILKSPSSLVDDEGQELGRAELLNSAPFAGTLVKYSTISGNKKNKLDLFGEYRRAFLTGSDELRSSMIDGGVLYKFDNRKKFQLTSRFEFRNFVKTGEDLDNLIGAPLSYNRFILSNTFRRKVGERSTMSIAPKTILKSYPREGFEDFKYWENGLTFKYGFQYHLKKKSGFYLEASARQRNYIISRYVENEEMEEEEGDIELEEEEGDIELELEEEDLNTVSMDRLWRYYSAEVGTKLLLGNRFKLLASAGYTYREDITQRRLGFSQTELSLELRYKYKKWAAQIKASHLGRDYTQLKITNNGANSALRFDYLRTGVRVDYKLGGSFTVFVSGESVYRLSSVDRINSRAFRTYFMGEASVGFTYKLRGNWKKRKKHK